MTQKEEILQFAVSVRQWLVENSELITRYQLNTKSTAPKIRDLMEKVQYAEIMTGLLYDTTAFFVDDDYAEDYNAQGLTAAEQTQLISDIKYYLEMELAPYGVIALEGQNFIEQLGISGGGGNLPAGGSDGWIITQYGGVYVWEERPTLLDAGEL